MPSIKEYNIKIKSLKNTQKITRTMKMVSASKLRKAHEAQMNAKSYAYELTSLISRIEATMQSTDHPLLKPSEHNQKALILIFTSDKGLCGAFNNNAVKNVLKWLAENKSKYENIQLSFCGRRGYTFFKNKENVKNYYEDTTANPNFHRASEIGEDLINSFINHEYDEIFVVYNQFFSPLSQEAIFQKILPINSKELITEQEPQNTSDYEFEPEARQMLDFLIPHFIYFKIYFALLENSAGEHGARMSAMDNASKNASDLINKNTLLRNRARQAQITTELTEIVAGAEALQ